MSAKRTSASAVLRLSVRTGDSEEQLVGIGAAAEQAGVSQRALRYYQQLGLLTPRGLHAGRTCAGTRRRTWRASPGSVSCRPCSA